MRWYVSRYTGVFRDFAAAPLRAHDPDIAICAGEIANRPVGARADAAGGAGLTTEAAELAAAGEAIERWQTHLAPSDRVRRGRFAAWDDAAPALDPRALPLYHAAQYATPGFPFAPLTRDTELDWLGFRRTGDGEPIWVPAELAAMDLRPGARHRFAPAISTGWSAHRDLATAVLRGTQEVIERDALMRAWLGACEVEEHALADVLGELAPRVRRANLTYRGYRIASPWSDHATMVTVAGEDREGFCFAIGSACRETRAASWRKALLEAIQGRHYVRYLRATRPPPPDAPRDFAEHAALYSFHPERLARTCLARAVPPRAAAAAQPESLASLRARLGPDRAPLFRVMTPPAFAVRGLDWCVARVIVPGLQPMHGDHALPFLGGPAWGDRPITAWADVPPHPFA